MPIRILNRGVGGEVAPEMLARLDRDVLAEKPDLVIWQLGTNSVLHDATRPTTPRSPGAASSASSAAGADVMLMDLQYAPAVLLHPRYRDMLHALAGVADSEDVAALPPFCA